MCRFIIPTTCSSVLNSIRKACVFRTCWVFFLGSESIISIGLIKKYDFYFEFYLGYLWPHSHHFRLSLGYFWFPFTAYDRKKIDFTFQRTSICPYFAVRNIVLNFTVNGGLANPIFWFRISKIFKHDTGIWLSIFLPASDASIFCVSLLRKLVNCTLRNMGIQMLFSVWCSAWYPNLRRSVMGILLMGPLY